MIMQHDEVERKEKRSFIDHFQTLITKKHRIEIDGFYFKVKAVKANGRLSLKLDKKGVQDVGHKEESDPLGPE